MSIPIHNPMPGPGPINPVEPIFKPLSLNNVIAPIGKFPNGGDIHEHIGMNSSGDILWGNTTVRLPGDRNTHMNWR